MQLEICCYSIDDAVIAYKNGANRIEFCSGRADGGLTPSYGSLTQLSALQLPIAIHPIIRPRGGDFCYSQSEIDSMIQDIELIKALNFSGVVFGCLSPDGKLDQQNMQRLISVAKPLSITFHRAFDVCFEPLIVAKQLHKLGVNRILTSGQHQNAIDGISQLEQLLSQSNIPILLAGSGIKSTNIQALISIGIQEFHASATEILTSVMSYQNSKVNMGSANQNEYLRYAVDPNEVMKLKKLIKNH